jgi:hypothetical protein
MLDLLQEMTAAEKKKAKKKAREKAKKAGGDADDAAAPAGGAAKKGGKKVRCCIRHEAHQRPSPCAVTPTTQCAVQHHVCEVALLVLHMTCLQHSSTQTSCANNML